MFMSNSYLHLHTHEEEFKIYHPFVLSQNVTKSWCGIQGNNYICWSTLFRETLYFDYMLLIELFYLVCIYMQQYDMVVVASSTLNKHFFAI